MTGGARSIRARGLCAVVGFGLLVGCSSAVNTEPYAAPERLTAAEQESLADLAVRADQLPALRETSRSLTRQDVEDLADLPDLGETLDANGFRGGMDYELRGKSRQLTGVESQVLAFSSAQGAASFGDYLSANAAGFFGVPTGVKRVDVRGRSAWVFDPPLCNCAGAQPFVAGAMVDGADVLVLQITGPQANAHLFRRLLKSAAADRPTPLTTP